MRKRELIGFVRDVEGESTRRAALLTNVGMPNLSTAVRRVNIKLAAEVTSA